MQSRLAVRGGGGESIRNVYILAPMFANLLANNELHHFINVVHW
jgi:hypothetical protein